MRCLVRLARMAREMHGERVMDDNLIVKEHTEPLVVALYPRDLAALQKIVEVRNASRPEGARKISRSAVVRALIRECANPGGGEQSGE